MECVSQFKDILAEGDMRTTGRSHEAVKIVMDKPDLFGELFACLYDEHAGVRMRAADALEKISYRSPYLLLPFKDELLSKVTTIKQQEVQWHVAQMISYLKLKDKEARQAFQALSDYFENSASGIVRAMSLQTMSDLTKDNPHLRGDLEPLAKRGLGDHSAAVRKKAEKILSV